MPFFDWRIRWAESSDFWPSDSEIRCYPFGFATSDCIRRPTLFRSKSKYLKLGIGSHNNQPERQNRAPDSDYLPPPGGQLLKILACRVGRWGPFFRRRPRGLLCGAGVARSRGRGGPGGARESRSKTGHTKTRIAVKIQNETTATMTTSAYYIISIDTM